MIHKVEKTLSRDEAKSMVDQEVVHHEPDPVLRGDTVVDSATNLPIMFVGGYAGDLGEYRRAMREVKFGLNNRASGMKNVNTNFGFTGRTPVLRRAACSICTFAHKQPKVHAVVERAASPIWETFEDALPEQAHFTRNAALGVGDDWRMAGTPWTSGVINETSALYYHFDRNNFAGSWSAMIVVRRDARGGHLHLPEYNLTIDCRDGDVIYFPGSQILHGVTPIARNKNGYRISAVYYSVSKMSKCLPVEEELKWAQRQRTTQAENLMDRQRKNGLI